MRAAALLLRRRGDRTGDFGGREDQVFQVIDALVEGDVFMAAALGLGVERRAQGQDIGAAIGQAFKGSAGSSARNFALSIATSSSTLARRSDCAASLPTRSWVRAEARGFAARAVERRADIGDVGLLP